MRDWVVRKEGKLSENSYSGLFHQQKRLKPLVPGPLASLQVCAGSNTLDLYFLQENHPLFVAVRPYTRLSVHSYLEDVKGVEV